MIGYLGKEGPHNRGKAWLATKGKSEGQPAAEGKSGQSTGKERSAEEGPASYSNLAARWACGNSQLYAYSNVPTNSADRLSRARKYSLGDTERFGSLYTQYGHHDHRETETRRDEQFPIRLYGKPSLMQTYA
jgi:hypothetical protein